MKKSFFKKQSHLKWVVMIVVYEAHNLGLINSPEDMKNLTLEELKPVVSKYNGYGEKADEYASKVYEYLSDVQTLLIS